MTVRKITCIECPMGCEIEVGTEAGKPVWVKGNTCPRGKMYAENEVVCPVRVVTSTVRADNGILIPVKTDKPVKKGEIFEVMKKINAVHPRISVRIGDVLVKNIAEGVDLVASGNAIRPIEWIIRH